MINMVSHINFNITLAAFCLHSANQLVQKFQTDGRWAESIQDQAETVKVKLKNDTSIIQEGVI